MNLADLKKPFAPDRISWRVGSTAKDKKKGMALAYIDARDVQDRLDEVCGVEGWQCRFVPMHDKKTVCEIGIRTGLSEPGSIREWVWKADGAGDSDVEAEKGALSDAFKRAAVKWGVGRYLYDLDSPWVALEEYGNPAKPSYKIADGEYARLRTILAKDAGAAPAPAHKPAAVQALADPKPHTKRPTLAEWVDAAPAEILALKTSEEMSAWLQKNNVAIEMLHDKDKALYNAINAKIAHRNDELRRLAA